MMKIPSFVFLLFILSSVASAEEVIKIYQDGEGGYYDDLSQASSIYDQNVCV